MSNSKILSLGYNSLSRYEKGYKYEYENWCMLDKHNFSYESNPKDFSKWRQCTNTGFDIKVLSNDNSGIKVECKFTLTPIYHSWFMRDWYTRNCDVIVTNNKWNVSYEDRKLLKQKGTKLFNTYEFLWYLLKILSKGNKYSYKCSYLKQTNTINYKHITTNCIPFNGKVNEDPPSKFSEKHHSLSQKIGDNIVFNLSQSASQNVLEMKSSKADKIISTKLTRLKKVLGVTTIKLRQVYNENFRQIREEYPDFPEHNQKVLAYRGTATWAVKNYSHINHCDDCLRFWKGECKKFLQLKKKLEQLKKLQTLEKFSSGREKTEKVREEICKLEDKILGCRKSRTIQENKGYSMFKKNPISKKPKNTKKANKPAIPKSQVSLSKYCT